MADVQLKNGYTRIANELLAAIAIAPWESPSQPCMALGLMRATYGFNRRDAALGKTQWAALTGMSDRNVLRAKQALEAAGVIVMIGDADHRTHRPQVWRLQKDYTKWGRFAVPVDAVRAAEEAAAGAGTPLVGGDTVGTGVPVSPVVGGDAVGSGDPVTQEGGDPVTPLSLEPVTPLVPPTEDKPLSRNDSPGGKDRKDRKDRTDTAAASSSVLPRAHAPAREDGSSGGSIVEDEMRAALDELLADIDDISRRGFRASAESIIAGRDKSAWLAPGGAGLVDEAERPRLFRLAIERCVSERRFASGELRKALRYVIPQQLDPFPAPIAVGSEAAVARDREARAGGRPRQPNGRARSSEPAQAMAPAVPAPALRPGPTLEQRQRVTAWGRANPEEAQKIIAQAEQDMGVWYATVKQRNPEQAKQLLVDQFTRRVVVDVLHEEVAS